MSALSTTPAQAARAAFATTHGTGTAFDAVRAWEPRRPAASHRRPRRGRTWGCSLDQVNAVGGASRIAHHDLCSFIRGWDQLHWVGGLGFDEPFRWLLDLAFNPHSYNRPPRGCIARPDGGGRAPGRVRAQVCRAHRPSWTTIATTGSACTWWPWSWTASRGLHGRSGDLWAHKNVRVDLVSTFFNAALPAETLTDTAQEAVRADREPAGAPLCAAADA